MNWFDFRAFGCFHLFVWLLLLFVFFCSFFFSLHHLFRTFTYFKSSKRMSEQANEWDNFFFFNFIRLATNYINSPGKCFFSLENKKKYEKKKNYSTTSDLDRCTAAWLRHRLEPHKSMSHCYLSHYHNILYYIYLDYLSFFHLLWKYVRARVCVYFCMFHFYDFHLANCVGAT